jgi:hypothetical protein
MMARKFPMMKMGGGGLEGRKNKDKNEDEKEEGASSSVQAFRYLAMCLDMCQGLAQSACVTAVLHEVHAGNGRCSAHPSSAMDINPRNTPLGLLPVDQFIDSVDPLSHQPRQFYPIEILRQRDH